MKLEGYEELIELFDEFNDIKGLRTAMEKATLTVERAAKENCVNLGGKGTLKSSITSKVTETDTDIVGEIGTPLQYAPYVEYGTGLFAEAGNGRKDVPWFYKDEQGEWHSTSGMTPHPFLRPAFNNNREEIFNLLSEGLKKN